MKHFPLLRTAALAAVLVSLAPPATVADEYDKKTIVTFDQPTEVPGIVLQPGKYVIKLLNSSSNRHIAEIMNERMDHLYALTFTTAAERLWPLSDQDNKRILTFYEGKNGQPQAVRQWFWPGETIGQEFLYPKGQAAKIASNTGEKVPEGNLPSRADSGQSLTPDNANGVTLQSSNQSKPAATPFTASAAEPAAPTVIAQNAPAPSPQTQQPSPSADNSQSSSAASSNSTDSSLPQTASHLPLIGLIGLISLAFAILMAFVRRSGSLS